MKSYLHYPSRLLTDDDVLRITDVGRTVMKRPESITRYADVTEALSTDVEQALLTTLSTGSSTCATLIGKTINAAATSRGAVEFNLLWLLKHGAIAIEKK